MSKKDWLVETSIALCALGVVACGGSSSSAADDEAAREEAQLEFAQCMREHGVDMEDPQPGQGGLVIGGVSKKGGDSGEKSLTDPATDEAMAACGEILEDAAPELSPEEEEERKEQALAFAQCMREHGVDMPDPQFGADGKTTQRIGGPGSTGPAPDSPVFEAALEACQDEMPGLPMTSSSP